MDAFRKQLDDLMGANRNGDSREVDHKYYDRAVCRLYLCGLCPHELFVNTKMDMGPCPKAHSVKLRRDYEEARKKGKENYDRELEDALLKIIDECDRKIQRALKRLQDEDTGVATAVPVSRSTKTPESLEISNEIRKKQQEAEECELAGKSDDKLKMMDVIEALKAKRAEIQAAALLEAFNKDKQLGVPQHIDEKLKQAEQAGESGQVDEAQRLMDEAEALKKRATTVVVPEPPRVLQQVDSRITDQKLRVCDICGAFLSIYDKNANTGLTDHLGGKLHVGYMEVRNKLHAIRDERLKGRDELPPPPPPREKERERDPERPRDRDRERDRERDRDRDRRKRERSRSPVRERERHSHRERDRDRDHERYRDRDDRGRGRDRDRR
ncbi:Luc7-like protein [Klebsormidium nitens]|uniref:Luc7-like protein n=1 Tax=Klebsormidium nitens TaxID=105231 RepID=A0A1Y1HY81_KLENI|nr:Luc7-like protein [Klebsormidium nitens]|eukprot:GAQ83605.1 Luc7-like protein [Klebsormidium nitens]